MLAMLFQDHKKLPAIWIEKKSLTYQELFVKIEILALSLTQQGINSRHRVAFIAETNLDSILLFYALLKIGASPCLLSTRIPVEKIPDYLKQSQSSFFLDCKTHSVQQCAVNIDPKENAILIFTSGSSGVPKLVSLKVEHFLANAQGATSRLCLTKESCYLLTVPLFHVSGLTILFRSLIVGSSIAFTSNLLEGHALASHISLVPTQLIRVLEKDCFFPHLKCALVGGAQISDSLVQSALHKKIPICLTYGMTEMASQITMTSLGDPLLPIHMGKPLAGREVTLASDGEILVKGTSLFLGYDSLLGVQKTLQDGNWFATGDRGAWDKKFNLEYKGRKDNLFISGGENIYPESIEEALGTIPGVLQAIVVPLEDREFGQRPVAFIHMQNKMLNKAEFHEKLSALLPRFSLPIHFLPFPLGLVAKSFKLKRSELKMWLQSNFLQ